MYSIYCSSRALYKDTSCVSARRTLCMKLCWAGQLAFIFFHFSVIPCNASQRVSCLMQCWVGDQLTVGYLAAFVTGDPQNFCLSNLLLLPVLYFATLSQSLHAPLHSNTCDVDCICIQSWQRSRRRWSTSCSGSGSGSVCCSCLIS